MEQEKQTGQTYKGPRNDIVLSRFSHLLLIVSQTVILEEPRSIYRSTYMYGTHDTTTHDTSNMEEGLMQREAGLMAKCFVCISQISIFIPSISVGDSSDLERHAEMVGVLYTPFLGPVL